MNESEIQQLINQCRNKERKSQFKLFKLFLPYLHTVCRRYLFDHALLDDVIQEIFVQIFRGIEQSFDEQKGSFKSWIRRIAINHCLKHNQRYRKVYELDEHHTAATINPKIFYAFSDEALLYLLEKMPAYYREVFNLFVIDGFSHKEISSMLEINEAVSRKRLSRARAWLKKTFEQERTLDQQNQQARKSKP